MGSRLQAHLALTVLSQNNSAFQIKQSDSHKGNARFSMDLSTFSCKYVLNL